MDYGMTAQAGKYFDNMQQRFRQDNPAIEVRQTPSHIAGFLDDLFTESAVTKPVGDLYIGTHAASEGFLFVQLFRGQTDVVGDPSTETDMEVLDQALRPSRPARIIDSMVGYVRATPPNSDPAPTHSVHIKGCNIGRRRYIPAAGKPDAPFLVRLKKVFGDNVNVTAPKHFHGLYAEENHNSIFEYMEHEFVVRTKAVKAGRSVRGFATRAELVAAYQAAHFSYYDGTPVPDPDWETLVPARLRDNRGIAMTLPLGRTLENVSTITVQKQLRIDMETVTWTIDQHATPPTADADRLALLRASIAADTRFKATHDWPMYERRGFPDFNSYMDGHLWTFSVDGNILNCLGRRFDYTIVQPIVDRSVTPPAKRPIIYNFYPGVGSPDAAILTGFVESDNRFFGRS